jgi:hypothetical protein
MEEPIKQNLVMSDQDKEEVRKIVQEELERLFKQALQQATFNMPADSVMEIISNPKPTKS